jgi:DNA-binding transcriptional regulator YiaG
MPLPPKKKPNRFAKLRIAVNMTQTEFAEALHVSPRTVSRWESGITKPSWAQIEIAEKLAEKKRY